MRLHERTNFFFSLEDLDRDLSTCFYFFFVVIFMELFCCYCEASCKNIFFSFEDLDRDLSTFFYCFLCNYCVEFHEAIGPQS